MQNNQTLRSHAALVDRMADAVGVDLEEMIMRGQLQIATLGDAVLGCTGCTNPGACRKVLDAQEAGGAAMDAAPDYCRNGDLFDLLKQGGSA